MAKLHPFFLKFHDAIKLGTFEEESTLQEKRDTLLENLKKGLPEDAPAYSSFNQGSYALGTGTIPPDGDYDIDVGVVFDVQPDDHDPVALKKTVRDALTHPNRTVTIRRPCVTVTYMKDEIPQFHVDLAIYAQGNDRKLYLAMGKESSGQEYCFWDIQDPKQLQETIIQRYSGDERKQFRRIVRYMKQWRHCCFQHNNLNSIGLTVAAFRWFTPRKDWWSNEFDDLQALEHFIAEILTQFGDTQIEEIWERRLVVNSPAEPWSDLLSRMTAKQMADLEQKLKELHAALGDARSEVDEAVACKSMSKFFGDDFPTPESEDETASRVRRSVITTGTSA